MQLVIGTYERFLLGYRLPEELQEGCQLQRSFTYAAHQGPVRCLDAAGPYVVSGGQDDQLHVYDIKKSQDLGFMMNPGAGAIPCLQFYTPPGALNPAYLFNGSEDGSIAIWKAGGAWEHLKLMRGHKGPVRSLSVHPSGRLALSVGHDRGLRMWNLAKGRCSYTAKLDLEADYIGFSADGESYALLCNRIITVHSVLQEGSITAKLQHSHRAVSLLQQRDGAALLSGLDNGSLCYWDIRAATAAPVWELEKAHNARIRAIVGLMEGAEDGGLPRHIATASSDGVVKIWDSRAISGSSSSSRLRELASVATNGRITGMVLSAPEQHSAAAAAAAAVGSGGVAAAADGQITMQKEKTLKKKKKQKDRKQQLQQLEGPELVAASQPVQQRQKQQQVLQQQQQQQRKQKSKKSTQQRRPVGAASPDAALVPRVQTKIVKRKKPNKEERQKAIAAAVDAPAARRLGTQHKQKRTQQKQKR